MPFHWRTSYPFPWMGGWLNNQEGEARERNIVVVVPGRDRRRAVCMCDHYDTAYMYDKYDAKYGGTGARVAAPGADDNHSATTTLMLAAPIFLEMSRKGRLGCDIWLVHLTGEEFPADDLGARALSQRLVERSLWIRLPDGRRHDLSKVQVQGLYDLDMVAHNNPRDRDVFQISPGTGPQSMWLAYQAHLAAEAWNEGAKEWNKSHERRDCQRGARTGISREPPPVALHPELHGEVRLPIDPRSTLFNTDGQTFSDAGIPAVLFMENYDINRTGYHDTHDTMENIDLDYGAAFAAIAIESVARAATEKPPV
jgi:Zn-dependent M28 family amino/carboxypeptidase